MLSRKIGSKILFRNDIQQNDKINYYKRTLKLKAMKTKFLTFLFAILFANVTASAQQTVTCGVFTFDVIITPITCNGDCDGMIAIANLTGGTPPYSFLWSNGDTDSTVVGLCFGNYTLIITDSLGNTCSIDLNVPAPLPITFSLVVSNVSCYGGNDGSICANSVNGGSGSYTYSWNSVPVQNTTCITNASAGTYALCVTDGNGCVTCDTATVLEPAKIQVSENITDASCSTCCDGEIDLFATGGTPLYTYTLSDSSGFSFFFPYSNLCPSTYNWCVSDANGCITCDTLVLSFPTAIKNNADKTVFSVYPNPFKDKIYLNTTKQFVEVYTVLGEKILQDYTNEIDLTTTKSGMYFIVIKDSDDTPVYKEKIVKE